MIGEMIVLMAQVHGTDPGLHPLHPNTPAALRLVPRSDALAAADVRRGEAGGAGGPGTRRTAS